MKYFYWTVILIGIAFVVWQFILFKSVVPTNYTGMDKLLLCNQTTQCGLGLTCQNVSFEDKTNADSQIVLGGNHQPLCAPYLTNLFKLLRL